MLFPIQHCHHKSQQQFCGHQMHIFKNKMSHSPSSSDIFFPRRHYVESTLQQQRKLWMQMRSMSVQNPRKASLRNGLTGSCYYTVFRNLNVILVIDIKWKHIRYTSKGVFRKQIVQHVSKKINSPSRNP